MDELPVGDKTPDDWTIAEDSILERAFKKPLRRVVYPLYVRWMNRRLERIYRAPFDVDLWLWGQRGNDYESLRRRVNRLCGIRDKRILILGCGTGKDIPSWLQYKPEAVTGVDFFAYDRAWEALARQYPANDHLNFCQGDAANLHQIADSSMHLVASDAVFEHLKNLPDVLHEMHRILVPGGAIYATFGPLWNAWGGDHVSGFDVAGNGYNHLLLSDDEYEAYLDGFGAFSHSEHDGRTWIRNGLFSYLRPLEYIQALEKAGLKKVFVALIIEPRGVDFLEHHPESRQSLLENRTELDLVVTGMTILFTKGG